MLQWVVKASRYCNLRCSYCYEWDKLGDRARMDLSVWRRVFEAMRDQREMESARLGAQAAVGMILHGGEPLALPLAYLRDVMDLKLEVLGPDSEENFGQNSNSTQSNLYSVTDSHIEFLVDYGFSVGVSLDVVPGVRLSVTGKETEQRVIQNISRLRSAGIDLGGIAVLASHTARDILRVYDFYARERMPCVPITGGTRPPWKRLSKGRRMDRDHAQTSEHQRGHPAA